MCGIAGSVDLEEAPLDETLAAGTANLLAHRGPDLGDRLPPQILNRRKHGFGVPVARWFRGELRGPFEELVLDPGSRTRELLRNGAARGLLDQHLSGTVDRGPRLWSLLVLEMWLRKLERPLDAGQPPPPDVAVAERNPS